ncbi:MAG: DUF4271 domain-containing protein [Flavobacteriales bacterium]
MPDSSLALGNSTLLDSLSAFSLSDVSPSAQAALPDTAVAYPNFFHSVFELSMQAEPSLIGINIAQFLLMLTTVLLLGFVNILYSRETGMILTTPFRRDGYRKLMEDENLIIRRAQNILSILFVFVLSAFVYDIFNYLDVRFYVIPYVPFYLNVFILVSALSLFRLSAAWITGYIFELRELTEQYNHRQVVVNCITGLVMLPFMIGLRLSPDTLQPVFAWSGIGVILLFYSLGLATCADLAWHSERISKYHIFLYFCTLEIAPFIILFKALSSLN